MMGSGKSLIGKILSKKLNLEFIDIDNKIEINEKKTISDIFKIEDLMDGLVDIVFNTGAFFKHTT